jgi:hypothetical protein
MKLTVPNPLLLSPTRAMKKKRTLRRLTLGTRLMLTRNWQAKLIALIMAFLFWYAVRSEIEMMPIDFMRKSKSKAEEAVKQHSLGGATQL